MVLNWLRRRARDRDAVFVGRVAGILAELGIAGVLDVGGNRGGYGASLRRAGYLGSIISFEPGRAAHEALSRAASGDPAWIVAPRMALGREPGSAEMNAFNRDDMNSLLAPTDATREAFPALQAAAPEVVQQARLDDALSHVAPNLPGPLLLKMDTQGSELEILAGATGILGTVAALHIEVALTPLYRGQPRFIDVMNAADGAGFEPVLTSEGFFSKRLNRQVDFDVLMLRRVSR